MGGIEGMGFEFSLPIGRARGRISRMFPFSHWTFVFQMIYLIHNRKESRMWFSDCLPSSFYKGGSGAYGYNGSFNAFIGYIHSIDVLRKQKEIASKPSQSADAIS